MSPYFRRRLAAVPLAGLTIWLIFLLQLVLRWPEYALLLFVLLLPLCLAGYAFLKLSAYWQFSIMAVMMIAVLKTNKALDTSSVSTVNVPVLAKYNARSRGGIITHHYKIPTITPPPFGLNLSDTESLSEDKQGSGLHYDEVVPGKAFATLKVHHGYFAIPWYETGYVLSNKNTGN